MSFMYVLENGQVPNQISLDNVLEEVNANDVRLSWKAPFTCSDFRVVVKEIREEYFINFYKRR